MEFSRQETGVGCHSLLQGIFPTGTLNQGFPHYRQILYCLSHQEKPNQRVPVGNLHSECVSVSHSVVFDSRDPADCSLLGSSVRNSLGKTTGVGCHFLLQGIFLTQGSNPGPLHCRQIHYHLSH